MKPGAYASAVTSAAPVRSGTIASGSAASAGERPADRGQAINQAGEERSARVESLRALAALAVVWGHVVAASLALNPALPSASDLGTVERIAYGGGYGVFFFFALTGYLLFWPFAKRYFGRGDSIDLRSYAVNRALRILPLYYAVVVVSGPRGRWSSSSASTCCSRYSPTRSRGSPVAPGCARARS